MSTQQVVKVPSVKQLIAGHFAGVEFTTPVSRATGEPIVQAHFVQCPTSGCAGTRYQVHSHSTLLYQSACAICCEEAYCNTNWYSNVTEEIQVLMAEVMPDYREALNQPEVQAQRESDAKIAHRLQHLCNKARNDQEAFKRLVIVVCLYRHRPATKVVLDYHNMDHLLERGE